jgi:uncharacterized repeat protein (TIGR01451 family)
MSFMSIGATSFSRRVLLTALALLGLLVCGTAQAQIQRSINNPSFELPFTGARAAQLNVFFTRAPSSWIAVDAGEILGWETTHPVVLNGCPAGDFAFTAPYNCTPIELWANSFLGVVPASGIVLAELNAYVSSKLFQNICMNSGETFTFNFAHRGRAGADQAQLQIGGANTVVLDVTTNTTGTGAINAGGATARSATGIASGWTRYAGTYAYTGASGVQPLGFSSIASAGGAGSGNLLDDINIALKPYVEFVVSAGSAVEGNAHSPPRIKVVGSVPAGGLTLTLAVSGTAVFGTKFNYGGTTTLAAVSGTASGLNVTVPAGNYSDALANNVFDLPVTVVDNAVVEDNTTVLLTMPANVPANAFVNANSTTCGGVFDPVYRHTIIDNDIDLQTTKISGPAATQAIGSTVAYTVTYANATPLVLTAPPLTGHNANTVTISDPEPAGVAFTAWTCTALGTTCPAATGTGPIAQAANLPVSSTLTYAVQAVVTGTNYCGGAVTNTSTIALTATSPAGSALAEGTSVQGNSGYVFKPNVATANNSFLPCANLGVTKTNNVNTLVAGQTVVYDVVVSNGGPSAANNAILQDPVAPGLVCTAVACTSFSGTATCPAPANVTIGLLQGTGILLDNLPANSSLGFQVTCGVL